MRGTGICQVGIQSCTDVFQERNQESDFGREKEEEETEEGFAQYDLLRVEAPHAFPRILTVFDSDESTRLATLDSIRRLQPFHDELRTIWVGSRRF